MWKTFIASPLAGGLIAVMGWVGALLFEGSMSEAEFASLRFGWPGAIVAGIAIASIIVLFLAASSVEPLVTVVCAALFGALLSGRRELPFSTANLESGTSANYWYAVTMMVAVFVLLLLGLRGARTTNNRAR